MASFRSIIVFVSAASFRSIVVFVSAALFILAVCVPDVLTRNETLQHGWVHEPTGRGTWSILWSCLSAFVCTWPVLYLNVPDEDHNYLYTQKQDEILVAMLAPEFYAGSSAQWCLKALVLLQLLRERGCQGWTLAHTQFAAASGFRIDEPERQSSSTCTPEKFHLLIREGRIDGPPISADELNSRGRGGSTIKLVAILQISWFVLQILVRAMNHHHITAIEMMTVGFVFCSTFTYSYHRLRPQNVEYQMILPLKDVSWRNDQNEGVESDAKSTNQQERTELSSAINSSKQMPSDFDGTIWTSEMRDSIKIVMAFFAMAFGVFHCLAWNSPFPSSNERLAWRICSTAMVALPGPMILTFNYRAKLTGNISDPIIILVFLVYAIARLALIILAFMSLRALPADAYETVPWTNYIPHFSF